MGDNLSWLYGFKLFKSKGDFSVDFGDAVKGEMVLFDSASKLAVTCVLLIVAVLN